MQEKEKEKKSKRDQKLPENKQTNKHADYAQTSKYYTVTRRPCT